MPPSAPSQDEVPPAPRPWPRAELVIATVATLVGVVMAVLIHGFFIRADVGAVGFDEGYIAAIGERMIDGRWLPYTDGASHRGPLLYWATALAEAIGGRFSWTALRVLTLLCTVATLITSFGVGVAARLPLAGAIGALATAYFGMFVLTPSTGIALNGEMIAAPLAVTALLLTTVALCRGGSRRRQRTLVALAGAAASASMLAKQTALVVVAPLALWVAAAAWSDDELDRRERWQLLLLLAAGWATPLFLVMLRYVIAGELGTFWYWFYGYNAEIYMRPYGDGAANQAITNWITAESIPTFAVCIALVWSLAKTAAPLARIRSGGVAKEYAAIGLEATVALIATFTLAAAMAPLRFWGHYFVVAAPWFGLLVGIRGEAMLTSLDRRTHLVRYAIVAAGLAGFVGWALHARLNGLNDERRAGIWKSATPDPICAAIHKHSTEADPIFIWGFDGDLYITCRRKPASRYTYTTLVAGIVPPFWSVHRKDLVARGSRQTLATEIATIRPPLILDIPAKLGGMSITEVPRVSEVVRKHYCELESIDGRGFRVAYPWVLKSDEPCPPPPERRKSPKDAVRMPFRLDLFAPKKE